MKHHLKQFALITILLCSGLNVRAYYDTIINGVAFITHYNNTASVTYLKQYGNNYSGDIIIPSAITYKNKVYSVTSIGEAAFANCDSLTSVVIPSSVTKIDFRAFANSGVTTVSIPNSITYIGKWAFQYSNLESVTIPRAVTYIGEDAFGYCIKLKVLNYDADSCTEDAWYSSRFRECDSLTTINIGDSVQIIPGSFIYGLKGIKSITIPSNVKHIGYSAFGMCTGLEQCVIEEGVESIANGAFSGSGITNITIPKSIQYIGGAAFTWCKNLKTVNYNAINCNKDEYGGGYVWSWFQNCDSLETVNIGDSVQIIPEYFIFQLNNVKTVNMGSNITTIGDYAFGGCENLKSITIPSKVTSIGEYALSSYCDTIISYASTPPYMKFQWIFGYTKYILVPCGSLESYNTADGWKEFTANIQTKTYDTSVVMSFCYGEMLGDYTVTENSVIIDTLQSVDGCDSIITRTLVVNPIYDTTITETICIGQNYSDNGFNVNQAGVYTLNLQTKNGCDSTVTLNLSVVNNYDTTITLEICSEDIPAGIFVQNLTSIAGCDSIIHLNMTYKTTEEIYDTIYLTDTIIASQTDTIILTDTVTVTEYLHDTITNTVYDTTILTQLDTVILHDTITNEITLYDTVTLFDTITNEITLYDTVALTDTIFIYDTIISCATVRTYIYATIDEGSVYEDYGFNVSDAGTHILNLQTEDGCDSIVTLYLSFNSGIDDITETKVISIYPNPAKDKVTIKADGNVTVFNTNGQMVKVIKDIKGSKDINVSDLESGVYYVKIGDVTKKLIVK